MNCARCGGELIPDHADTNYQFDNCLWIGFYGGYGMFVDNIDATMPDNTEDRWLCDRDGNYYILAGTEDDPYPRPVPNLHWTPAYAEERMLSGQPDYETVICHDCAHDLCAREPWLNKLLNPRGSHSHRSAWMAEHPEHFGWDYDSDRRRREQQEQA